LCSVHKVEARSVEHMKNVARGLENKIIELQQKLTEKVMDYRCCYSLLCMHVFIMWYAWAEAWYCNQSAFCALSLW